MAPIDYFTPGKKTPARGPLARYGRPLPAGVATAYVEAHTEPGDVVLDPFCQSVAVLREATAAGRRAIAANFNPLHVLAVRWLLAPPDPGQLAAAVTRLGDTPKLDVPLREHIENLYRTACRQCQRPVSAGAFVWEREKDVPVEVTYECPACGRRETAPVEPGDLERLGAIEKRGLHYWYALDRIAPPDDVHRETAQRLLALYTPRNIYALTNLLLKIESLFADTPQEEWLKMVLLASLDRCSSLDAPSGQRPRPRRLRRPPRFVERNVWRAFEQASEAVPPLTTPPLRWTASPRDLFRSSLLSLTAEGGANAFLEPRTVRQLGRELPPESIALMVTSPPPLDPVLWSLSWLWVRWLWGDGRAAALTSLLNRRAGDWEWYWRAMAGTFRLLRERLRPDGCLVLAFEAGRPTPAAALMLAAAGAGLALESLCYQPEDGGQYRLVLGRGEGGTPPAPDVRALAGEVTGQVLEAAVDVLRRRGEPLARHWLHLAAYDHLSRTGHLRRVAALAREGFSALDFMSAQLDEGLERGLASGTLVCPTDGSGEEACEGREAEAAWWLGDPQPAAEPLADRVERAAHEVLRDTLAASDDDLAASIYARFPGLLTPEASLIAACLASYGEEITPGYRQLRLADQPRAREHQQAQSVVDAIKLGQRLGYGVGLAHRWREHAWPGGRLGDVLGDRAKAIEPLPPFDVVWYEGEEVRHAFVVISSAALHHLLSERRAWAGDVGRYIVLPDERAALLDFKQRRSPWLRRRVAETGWQFIKARHLTWLAGAKSPDRHDLKKIVGLRPIIEQAEAQIPLF